MREKLKVLIKDKEIDYDTLIKKLGWTRTHFFNILEGVEHPNDEDLAELGLHLGESLDFMKLACMYKTNFQHMDLQCPWCNKFITIFVEENLFDTMKNIPENCKFCQKPLFASYLEDGGQTFLWLKRDADVKKRKNAK